MEEIDFITFSLRFHYQRLVSKTQVFYEAINFRVNELLSSCKLLLVALLI